MIYLNYVRTRRYCKKELDSILKIIVNYQIKYAPSHSVTCTKHYVLKPILCRLTIIQSDESYRNSLKLL